MTATARHAATEDLQRRVLGPVRRPGDERYAAEVAGFDLGVDQRPAVIVAATGPADIAAGVRHALDAGPAVGVQATGHSIAVPALRGLVVVRGPRSSAPSPSERSTSRSCPPFRTARFRIVDSYPTLLYSTGFLTDVGLLGPHLPLSVPVTSGRR